MSAEFERRYGWGLWGSSTAHRDNPSRNYRSVLAHHARGNLVVWEAGSSEECLLDLGRNRPLFPNRSTADAIACRRCGVAGEPNGDDPCIAGIDGAFGACCGHGVEPGYVDFGTSRADRRRYDLCINCRFQSVVPGEARCDPCHAWVLDHEDERPWRAVVADLRHVLTRTDDDSDLHAVAVALERSGAAGRGTDVILRLPPLSWA